MASPETFAVRRHTSSGSPDLLALRYRLPQDQNQTIFGLDAMAKAQARPKFVLCIENKDCDDLEKGKVYLLVPDAKAKRNGYIRVIDESGEDYLYPETHFVQVDIPPKGREALSAAS